MRRLLYILLLLLVFGCDKDKIGPQFLTESVDISEALHKVYLVNEGNFGWGTGSISVYDPSSAIVSHQAFSDANGFALGDVAQSMTRHDNKFYMVVNNSGKVEVMDTANLQSTATITGLNSPRFFLGLGNKGYVTDLYANAISVVDLTTNAITSQIAFGDWTDRIIAVNGSVYVGAVNTGNLLEIDPATDLIVDTIPLTKGVGSMVVDDNGMLWVLCSGGINDQIPQLYQIDPTDNSIVQSFAFGTINEGPNNLCIDPTGTMLYFVNGGIFSIATSSAGLPATALISANSRILYSLAVDPNSGELYASDAIDYVQASDVYRYSASGNLIETFKGGTITTSFWFE
jgi:DNA-binding beta-propeller fold protein YncE